MFSELWCNAAEQNGVPVESGTLCWPRDMGPKSRPFEPEKVPVLPPDASKCRLLSPIPTNISPILWLDPRELAHDPSTVIAQSSNRPVARCDTGLYSVFERYPTVAALAEAQEEDVVGMIRCLGFQNARARKCIALAKLWVESPPVKGKRYRKLHYPNKGDGRDIKPGECVGDDDTRVAWEIAHLPGLGSYALDSWRIFCRDELRGLARDWDGAEAPDGFVPEWKSVVPKDKELRGFLTWVWLKEGWEWETETGRRRRASKKLRRAAMQGSIAIETNGSWILESSMAETSTYFEKTIQDK
ncbi:conserved hypothetical protein [Histoplasma capsulatum H143]|uniref:HhH-GPD domain-containing protein n=1 Tax=Ajellomyces capsulatus (strain H143) TaxID=544712 RepID=C6HS32_AJECH|nr:conserved hypothetical protein [Histoplasma capsulatum H143]